MCKFKRINKAILARFSSQAPSAGSERQQIYREFTNEGDITVSTILPFTLKLNVLLNTYVIKPNFLVYS